MSQKKDTDYPYIRAWGKMMGSGQYYIDAQVARARETNAPQNATYEKSGPGGRDTGEWSTLDECMNPNAFRQMGLLVPERIRYNARVTLGGRFSTPGERDQFVHAIQNQLRDLNIEISVTTEDWPNGKATWEK